MSQRQCQYRPTPWLISDARNDAVLELALARMPRGSGFIFRHYHLSSAERRARFDGLARLARRYGHSVILSGTPALARRWGADGAYGPPEALTRGPALLRLAAVHSLRELAKARRANAVLLSPVFATRSHPGSKPLGTLRFRLIAAASHCPVIALGGMTKHRATALGVQNWAAIDGICDELNPLIPKDS